MRINVVISIALIIKEIFAEFTSKSELSENMKIYKYIYYYDFLRSAKKNSAPEIPVYTSLTFVQTSNIISVLNLFLIASNIKLNYNLPLVCLILPPVLFLFNHYYFGKKGNGKIIMADKNYSLGRYSFLVDVYSISSYLVAGLIYYVYRGF